MAKCLGAAAGGQQLSEGERVERTVRGLTLRYTFALGLIACMAIAAFLVLEATISSQNFNASVIGATSRQNERIREVLSIARALVAAEDPTLRAARRAELFEAAHAIERMHEKLTDQGHPLGTPIRRSAEVRAFYTEPPLHLAAAISEFARHAYGLAGASDHPLDAAHPDFERLQRRAPILMMSLRQVVDQLETEALASLERVRIVHLGLLLSTLLLLSIEATFIFRPIAGRLRREGERVVRAQEQLQELAHFDMLTGLPNRALFNDRLGMALATAAREDTLAAVLQLDLDDFKDINDTHGHPAGDHLLCEVARRLQELLRRSDTVARLGGDEFAIILQGLRRPEDAAAMARRILEALQKPVTWQDQEIHTATSIGITIYPSDDEEPAQLLRNADIALYAAKAGGRKRFAFFVGEMKQRVEERARIERELRDAIASEAFEIVYQPQIRLDDQRVVGVEAFLRWRHPKKGLLRPQHFLTVAEDTGLIVPIGDLVVRKALADMARWQADGIAPDVLAINVSAVQLRAQDFARDVVDVLDEHGVSPACLELEVKEEVLVGRGHEKVAQVLDRLHDLGVSVALDDFGTGHASLPHLKRVGIDRLKIDRSFIGDLEKEPEDAAITRAVLGLGEALGLEVVAEGVEWRGQVEFLREHGCRVAQGDYFMPPGGAEEMARVLEHGSLVGARRTVRLAAG